MRPLLFLLFPALELYLLVKVGAETGALNMVLWVFLSAGIGLWAVRSQGQEAMNRARAEIAAGRVPQDGFLDGLLLFLGGVLLILPGLISDAVGLFLLLPPCRRWAGKSLAGFLSRRQTGAQGASRVIFFRSSAPGGPFGQPGDPFAPGSDPLARQGDPFGQTGGPHDGRTGAFEAGDSGPRQAVIIESTAIEINPGGKDGEGAQHEAGKEK